MNKLRKKCNYLHNQVKALVASAFKNQQNTYQAVHLDLVNHEALTCDPLFEVPDESEVTVGSGSVSLKYNWTHYDKLKGLYTLILTFCLCGYMYVFELYL